MPEALRYLLVVEVAGLVAWPLLARALPTLPDRGFALAKSAGLFALALVELWLAASGLFAELPTAGRTGVALLLLATAAAALLAASPSPLPSLRRVLTARRSELIALEILFLVAFAGGLLLRAADPGIHHTEQPMDRMLLGAIQQSPGWPPADPWLANVPLGYYTLGHAAVAAPARLAGVAPDFAYNIGLALWGALVASGAAGVALALARPLLQRRRRTALALALAGSSLVAVSGLAAVRDALVRLPGLLAGRVGDPWWWWASSRTLVDSDAPGGPAELIHESPAFTFLIGDLHAHLLALPLLLLAAALALTLARRPRAGPVALLAAALGGAAIATNTWTLPAIAAVAGAGAMATSSRHRWRLGVLAVSAVLLGGAVLALPHLLLVQGAPSALVVHLGKPSSAGALVALWLPIVPGVALLLANRLPTGRGPSLRLLAVTTTYGLAAALATAALAPWAEPDSAGGALRLPLEALPTGFAGALSTRGVAGLLVPFVLGAAAALAIALASRGERSGVSGDGARRAGLALAAVGLLLVLVPEVLYLRDGHATRLNTLFKAHSSAWPLLFLAAIAGTAAALAGRRRTAAAVALAPILASALFPATVAADRLLAAPTGLSLDASTALGAEAPDEAAVLAWIRDNVPRGATVLQAPAPSYDSSALRVSVFAARPTLLGWEGHEAQWRGGEFPRLAQGREPTAAIVYESPLATEKIAALDRFAIDWIYLGPAERRRYRISPASLDALEAIAEVRFERGEVRILARVPP